MSTSAQPTEPAGRLVVADATCTACGCLCDDIDVVVEGGRIIEARRACERGTSWFLIDRARTGQPSATIDGQPVTLDEAIDRAAEILGHARAPLVLGLTETSLEAQAAAVALADRIGGMIAPGHAEATTPWVLAFQRLGRVSATLGEVKNRADVVVFWGADPIVSHPRHWERYSVEPAGRFVPEGRPNRTVLVADAERTATADRADHFLRVSPEAELAVLVSLRALVNEVTIDTDRTEHATSLRFAELSAWADSLKRARYGACFLGAKLGREPCGQARVEAALALVRDLNAHTRFVALTLGEPGNAAGAEAVLTWQSGFPLGADFRRGAPRFLPGETTATALLVRGAVDAALLVGNDPASAWPEAAQDHWGRIPRVQIAPTATAFAPSVTVTIESATCGIEAPGTVLRCDGVSLPLRPALACDRPTDREVLRAIEARVR
jgi:formylmethanofuran dehydrogenase subunit B